MSKRNLIITASIILVFWAAFPFIVHNFLPGENNTWSNSGTFGDTYGGLNALFSGATILGLVYTIYLQIKQDNKQTAQNAMQEKALRIQRKELKLQREELALQREEMAATRNEFIMNRATTIVYSQIERLDHTGSKFKIKLSGDILENIDAFNKLFDSISFHKPINASTNGQCIDIIIDNIESISHYCRIFEDSIQVLRGLFLSNKLNSEEIKDLLNLFFLNIGLLQLSVVQRIDHHINKSQKYYFEDPSSYDEDYKPATLSFLQDKTGTILSTYSSITTLNNENLEAYKELWRASINK